MDLPAVSWCRDGKRETESCYWNREILDLFRPLESQAEEIYDAIVNDEESEDGDDFLSIEKEFDVAQISEKCEEEEKDFSTIFSTSYETLLLLAAGVVQQIREEYFDDYTGKDGNAGGKVKESTRDGSENIVFAVTTPEGPLLPLSVLVVHALNVRLHQNHRHFSHAVLVPMSLDEGKDRNSHILNDARPTYALAVPGNDSEKLFELIETNKSRKHDGIIGFGVGGSPSPATRVLDLVGLLKVARKKLSILSTKFEARNVITSVNTTVSSLQSLVSELAFKIGTLSSESISEDSQDNQPSSNFYSTNKISHIIYTSGTTGRPKGCISSTRSLLKYIAAKNIAHEITETSVVLVASALSFDPCLSDIIASLDARATLAITPPESLISSLPAVLKELRVTHVLCTPTLWSLTLLHRFETTTLKQDFPHLQRVALGGEPIPNSIVLAWARPSPSQNQEHKNIEIQIPPACRLLATYGVTEACVYQTCGEIFSSGKLEEGQRVGHALLGTEFKICQEEIQGDKLVEVSNTGMPGEIVLLGDQIDSFTKYLNRPDLDGNFVTKSITVVNSTVDGESKQRNRYHYRTGDRGRIRPEDGSLVVLGRIVGEEGLIKINGVRVELGEIESALLSDENSSKNSNENSDDSSIVTGCLVNCVKDQDGRSTIHAYCVFRDEIWKELGIRNNETGILKDGVIINGGPLWTILRTKCSNRLRKACIPTTFVGIRQLPLSRTGKQDRSGLPKIKSCSVLNIYNEMSTPLQDYGVAGSIVFETLVQYLNLQPCQQKMVTTSISFAILGGDSLSAVVVCRSLYAHFYQLKNSRHLGGEYSQLPQPFNTESFLRTKNLGEYVDLLDASISINNLQKESSDQSTNSQTPTTASISKNSPLDTSEKSLLYDALLQAITLDQTSIASALLYLGADSNHGHNHGSRIGNTSGRIQRRAVFKATPLHLACFRGNSILVKLLLSHNASYKSPNTNGLFPIHLASGGVDVIQGSNPRDECRRLECVKSLMEAGCPLLIKDANKQSILHAAARAGHVAILKYVIEEHQSTRYNGPVPLRQFLEFQDKWFRSALHWAVLHGRVEAVKVLLEKGSNPSPYKPRSNNKQTSMMTETPLEICKRLHGSSDKGIKIEKLLLAEIK